jgi:hypothetical protein
VTGAESPNVQIYLRKIMTRLVAVSVITQPEKKTGPLVGFAKINTNQKKKNMDFVPNNVRLIFQEYENY